MISRVLHNPLNGRFTIAGLRSPIERDACRCCIADSGTSDSYDGAISQKDSNYWSVTENSQNNAWNVNFGDDLDFLLKAIPKMEAFMKKMKLEMHQHKRYLHPGSHGLALVGSYIKPKRVYLSNRTLARFEERAVGFSRLIDGDAELTVMDCKRIEQVINSYLGFCKGKKTYCKRKKILGMMGKNFFKYFYIKGHYESIRAKAKYREIVLPFQITA